MSTVILDDALDREPAWLIARVEQVVADFKANHLPTALSLTPVSIVVLMLDEETSDKCDNCGKRDHCLIGHVDRNVTSEIVASIVFAGCIDCLAKP